MTRRGLSTLLCLLAVLGFALSLGCSVTEERRSRRRYAVREDLHHMRDDLDWALGIDGPSILYDDTMTPGP